MGTLRPISPLQRLRTLREEVLSQYKLSRGPEFVPPTEGIRDPGRLLSCSLDCTRRNGCTSAKIHSLQFENLRKARSLHYPSVPDLYIRAIIPGPESDEIRVLSLLAASGVRNHPKNFANGPLSFFCPLRRVLLICDCCLQLRSTCSRRQSTM